MLIDISRIQDQLLAKYENPDLTVNDIHNIIQHTYENVAALTYCAQKIEHEIREQVMSPDFPFDVAQQVLSSSTTQDKIWECLDELCHDNNIDNIVDVSVDVKITDKQTLRLTVVPIYSEAHITI